MARPRKPQPEISADLVDLLRAVRAGKVARHRLGRNQSPVYGQDLQEVPGHGPGGLRKAAARLTTLRRHDLVHLPAGDHDAKHWPWEITPAGAEYLDHLDDLQRETREEAVRWLDDLDDEERAMAADIADRKGR